MRRIFNQGRQRLWKHEQGRAMGASRCQLRMGVSRSSLSEVLIPELTTPRRFDTITAWSLSPSSCEITCASGWAAQINNNIYIDRLNPLNQSILQQGAKTAMVRPFHPHRVDLVQMNALGGLVRPPFPSPLQIPRSPWAWEYTKCTFVRNFSSILSRL